jgi:hypothetical protein
VKARGVDSVGNGFADPVSFVKQLALKESRYITLDGYTHSEELLSPQDASSSSLESQIMFLMVSP